MPSSVNGSADSTSSMITLRYTYARERERMSRIPCMTDTNRPMINEVAKTLNVIVNPARH
jgi:hypothetical protein